MQQLTATALKHRLDSSEEQPLLLDVREPWEFDICHITGALLVPMGHVPGAIDELPRERDIVVICHHGIRSRQVCLFLGQRGFTRLYNLAGGMAAWSEDVDRSTATY